MTLGDLLDDSAFCISNDGTLTYCSYCYNSIDVLNLVFISSDIFTSCKWSVLDSIGSDYLPVFIEVKNFHKTPNSSKAFWNFQKFRWQAYKQFLDYVLTKVLPLSDFDSKSSYFRESVIIAANQTIPRGNRKKLSLNLSMILRLLYLSFNREISWHLRLLTMGLLETWSM